jgi:hypothetical protein
MDSIARGVLGLLNAAALVQFKRAIDTAYGNVAGRWYILLQASQFHVMFYASRTLPNMFAFGISKSIPPVEHPPFSHHQRPWHWPILSLLKRLQHARRRVPNAGVWLYIFSPLLELSSDQR